MKLCILDRDGTINEDSDEYINNAPCACRPRKHLRRHSQVLPQSAPSPAKQHPKSYLESRSSRSRSIQNRNMEHEVTVV